MEKLDLKRLNISLQSDVFKSEKWATLYGRSVSTERNREVSPKQIKKLDKCFDSAGYGVEGIDKIDQLGEWELEEHPGQID